MTQANPNFLPFETWQKKIRMRRTFRRLTESFDKLALSFKSTTLKMTIHLKAYNNETSET